jgi:hypothetical protein
MAMILRCTDNTEDTRVSIMGTKLYRMKRIIESAGYTVVVFPITDGVVKGWLSREGKTSYETVGISMLHVLAELARKSGISGIDTTASNMSKTGLVSPRSDVINV